MFPKILEGLSTLSNSSTYLQAANRIRQGIGGAARVVRMGGRVLRPRPASGIFNAAREGTYFSRGMAAGPGRIMAQNAGAAIRGAAARVRPAAQRAGMAARGFAGGVLHQPTVLRGGGPSLSGYLAGTRVRGAAINAYTRAAPVIQRAGMATRDAATRSLGATRNFTGRARGAAAEFGAGLRGQAARVGPSTRLRSAGLGVNRGYQGFQAMPGRNKAILGAGIAAGGGAGYGAYRGMRQRPSRNGYGRYS